MWRERIIGHKCTTMYRQCEAIDYELIQQPPCYANAKSNI